MKTYILLFRGINVGGRNILPMKDLAVLLEENGFEQVKTYIQSGNVILKGKKRPGDRIRSEIESRSGFKPEIMILELSDFEAAVKNNPYSSVEGKAIHFYFSEKAPKPDIDKLSALATDTERFELKGKVFYLFAPDGIGRSKLVANLEKCLGVSATGRNLNTINKLLKMAENA